MIQGPLSDAPMGWVGNINQLGGDKGHVKAMTFSVPTNCCQAGMWAHQHFQTFYCFKESKKPDYHNECPAKQQQLKQTKHSDGQTKPVCGLSRSPRTASVPLPPLTHSLSLLKAGPSPS